MLVSEASTKVRSGTLHDADTQVTDAQLLAFIADEYRRVRRWLCAHAPRLCQSTVSAIAVTGTTITKASSLPDFERLVKVEKLYGGTYYPVDVETVLMSGDPGALSVAETPTTLVFSPAASAPGTYQVTYLVGALATIVAGTAIDLPTGLEDVIVERACAWVRQRHRELEHVAYHERRAAEILEEHTRYLKQRYGAMGQPGLKREPRW